VQHDPKTIQLRNAVATLAQDLRKIRLGLAIPLSIEITTHLEFAEELVEQVDAGNVARLQIGGAA